jgi:hypothetical protein
MKRIYFKNTKCELFVDVYDNVLRKTESAYVLCCETREQLDSAYDLFRRVMDDVYTMELSVYIPRKYIGKVTQVTDA